MKPIRRYHKILLACLLPISLALTGCFHDEDDENMSPTADAGQVQTATELTTVTLSGSGIDSDGSIASYSWSQVSGSSVDLTNSDMATATFVVPAIDANEDLVLRLTVTDNEGATAMSDVTVTAENLVTTYDLTVKVTNITNGQPLTPAAVVLHKSGYSGWEIGTASSSGLEKLAESGSPVDFIAEADADTNVLTTGVAGSDAFGPGGSVSVDLSVSENKEVMVTLASMLANTNDAFAGNAQVFVGSLKVGDSMTVYSHVHDAGTELNTEAAGTIAGPADTSTAADKAYSAARDDIHDFVTLHPGVVTMDDGLTNSVLDESHRWMNVAARIDITRTQ